MIYDENDDYEYDYHGIIENAEELYGDEYYYDDGTNEPWAGTDADENESMDAQGWDNYYHDILDEIED